MDSKIIKAFIGLIAAFILVIAVLVQVVELVLRKLSYALYQALGVYLRQKRRGQCGP